ncbi:hypothetical protein EX30DRAFT_396209 [Ascodesmis nigricans]|uniref:DUF1308 domain-containing protein n=1 Tax=Ascodesmis nigricans TaxID=341454 RepID=A0A4S2MVC6_9PEZI|nr:hypothetical protein EX30DRAFT_396209 [Ascodesmis nigricans]
MSPKKEPDDPNDMYGFSSDEEAAHEPLNPAAEALLKRSYALLDEIQSFQRSLRRENAENAVVLGSFANLVKSEHRTIQGLCLEAPSPETKRSSHSLSAVNLPFYEAVWAAAKSTTGITALHKTFWYQEKELSSKDQPGGAKLKRKKSSVVVDVVAQNGLQWIKVNLLTPKRLLFDIAKAGWEEGRLISDDEDDYQSSYSTNSLAISQLALTKIASTLVLAASHERVQYLHPSVYFIFPRLPPPTDKTPEVKAFIDELTSLGVHVQCGPPSPDSEVFKPRRISELVEDISTPFRRRSIPVTSPVNLDVSILLSLASDICNCKSIKLDPGFTPHEAITHQIESEKTEPFLVKHVWAVLEGRDLVCSQVVADRFKSIVGILAGEKEAERADLLMHPREDGSNVDRFQKLCEHPLPEKGLRLPVSILGDDSGEEESEVMKRIKAKLSAVNRSAFMGGWKAGLTTVTSNKTVARMVEGLVNIDEVGPDFYVIDAARSLVGYKGKKIKV